MRGDADTVLFATPDYIDKIDDPTKPYDLRYAEFANMDHGDMMLQALNTLGLSLTEANFPLLSESYLAM